MGKLGYMHIPKAYSLTRLRFFSLKVYSLWSYALGQLFTYSYFSFVFANML